MYSPSIDKLIAELKKLPSVGPHTAERFVFYWLKSGKKPVTELTIALKALIDTVKSCEVCYNFSDGSPCTICSDPKRDTTTLCVVAEPWDLATLEATKTYNGRYFVTRAYLEGNDAESLAATKIPELYERVEKEKTKLKEIILAFNQDVDGEATLLAISEKLKTLAPNIVITRLARGLPLGSDMRYADEITLSSAIKNRTRK